jgi:hypothetical protein
LEPNFTNKVSKFVALFSSSIGGWTNVSRLKSDEMREGEGDVHPATRKIQCSAVLEAA